MNLPKNILVPTDFSEPAGQALDYAVGLAEKLGARITVMHTYEIPVLGFPDGFLVATADVAGHILNGAQERLTALVGPRKGRGVELTPLLKCGEARETIVAVAEEIGADLIVMGTHGRRGLAHALLGSVAEYVVRASPCPVFTIRDSDAKPPREQAKAQTVRRGADPARR